jgi:hypothetical protein
MQTEYEFYTSSRAKPLYPLPSDVGSLTHSSMAHTSVTCSTSQGTQSGPDMRSTCMRPRSSIDPSFTRFPKMVLSNPKRVRPRSFIHNISPTVRVTTLGGGDRAERAVERREGPVEHNAPVPCPTSLSATSSLVRPRPSLIDIISPFYI